MHPEEGNVLTTTLLTHEQPTFDTLSRILNRVQRHTCSAAYCLVKPRGARPNAEGNFEMVCRFHYPRTIHDTAIVTREFNPNWYIYDGERNDGRLNNHNRVMAMGWLANTDFAPCTDIQAVINYIAKYCSKAEKKTKPFDALAAELIPRVSSRQPVVSFAAKIMDALLTERDWSAQEVCHVLLGIPL